MSLQFFFFIEQQAQDIITIITIAQPTTGTKPMPINSDTSSPDDSAAAKEERESSYNH